MFRRELVGKYSATNYMVMGIAALAVMAALCIM